MIRRISVALLYIGFGSILSQILLVREFLVSFYGNELSLGIIFAWWLTWIGVGSAAGNKIIKRTQNISRPLNFIIAATPCVTALQILAVKFVRAFIYAGPGEFLSMIDLFIFSGIVLSAGCCLWGMLFTLGAKLLSAENKRPWEGVNKAYVLEAIGSVIGGLLFSFFLVSILSSFHIIILLFLIAWSVVFFLVLYEKKWRAFLFIIMMCIAYATLFNPLRILEHRIYTYQWSLINDKLDFIRSTDTKYQNLSLVRLNDQHTVYADGCPVYNIPNTYDAEVFIHSIMIHHSEAKRILLLGGGFNGLLKEILKYPVQEIEYVENDTALISFVEPVLSAQDQMALHDPRVRIVSGDGRAYLRQTTKLYDVIILDIGEPSTASLNRFFTLEFYRQCAARSKPEGILAFSFPSSAEYIADEFKDLDASILRTAKEVFRNILIIPGTHAILICSNSNKPFISRSDVLADRFDRIGISTEYFSKYMFEEIMPTERIKLITNTLESVQDHRINTDSDPITYYLDLLLWNRFLHDDNSFFSQITRKRIFLTGGIIAGLVLLLLILPKIQQEKRERTALAIIITCSGMIGMMLNLLFLLNFQETFGSIYEMVGGMAASNLFGLALGALVAVKLMHLLSPKKCIIFTLSALLLVVLFLPQLLSFLLFTHIITLTLCITMLSGGLTGILYGTVNRLFLQTSHNVGIIYAFDVAGSAIGALTTCAILLPVLGIQAFVWFIIIFLLLAVLAVSNLKPRA